MIGNILNSTNWPLVISIAALISTIVFNILSYHLSIKKLNFDLQKYKAEQEEKSRRVLDVSISQSNKYEHMPENTLMWLGIWLIINNRGEEQPLLSQLNITLHFEKKRKQEKSNLKTLFGIFSTKPKKLIIGFPLYSSTLHVQGFFGCSDQLPLNFYLIDWDNKTPIYFAPHKEYRMPEPGQKRRWYLFGNIPDDDGLRLVQQGFELKKIELTFMTDTSRINIEEAITTRIFDYELLKERSSYTFDFEEVTSSFLGPNYPA